MLEIGNRLVLLLLAREILFGEPHRVGSLLVIAQSLCEIPRIEQRENLSPRHPFTERHFDLDDAAPQGRQYRSGAGGVRFDDGRQGEFRGSCLQRRRQHGQAAAQRRAFGDYDLVALSHEQGRLAGALAGPAEQAKAMGQQQGQKEHARADSAP